MTHHPTPPDHLCELHGDSLAHPIGIADGYQGQGAPAEPGSGHAGSQCSTLQRRLDGGVQLRGADLVIVA